MEITITKPKASCVYRQQHALPMGTILICPKCNSTLFRFSYSRIECTNCGEVIKTPQNNKYGARKTEFGGRKFDSAYEADVAATLELRKKGKDIKDYDCQFKVVMGVYRADGLLAFSVNHKVDFRLHLNDGSFELLEAKGIETPDYKWRRRLLEDLWLPQHKDYVYRVVKQR